MPLKLRIQLANPRVKQAILPGNLPPLPITSKIIIHILLILFPKGNNLHALLIQYLENRLHSGEEGRTWWIFVFLFFRMWMLAFAAILVRVAGFLAYPRGSVVRGSGWLPPVATNVLCLPQHPADAAPL